MKYSIVFIGFGEAAFHISNGLKSEGLENIGAYDIKLNEEPFGSIIRKKADEAGVFLIDNIKEAYSSAPFVISLTSASIAFSVAQSIIPFLSAGQTYVDMNSAGPAVKAEIAEIKHNEGVLICDAAVMSTVPGNGHKVPMFLSGNGGAAFEKTFSPYGMKLTNLNKAAGGASAIKMFKSVIMKGLPQLMFESFEAAEKYGVLETLVSSLNNSLMGKSIEQLADTFIVRTIIHSKRRADEMRDVVTTLNSLGIDSTMSEATLNKLDYLTQKQLLETTDINTASDFKQAVKIILNS